VTIQIGRKLNIPTEHTLFLDGAIPESYQGSGSSWVDLSSASNSSTLVNSPTFSRTPYGAGTVNFNGSNQYGYVSQLGLTNSFTISAWIKKNDTTSTGWVVGAGWVATTGDGAGLGVALGVQGSTVALTTWGSGGYVSVPGLEANKWYHICAVQTAGPAFNLGSWNAKIYINGTESASGGFFNYYCSTTGGAAVSYIGRNSHSSIDSYNYFGGSIGQVIVYNSTILTGNQVRDIYKQTRGRYGT
jgi:hypothetical protein